MFKNIQRTYAALQEDLRNIYQKDPAARSTLELMLCYPGLQAIWLHRVAHWLWRKKCRFLARYLSYLARFLTNIDIHPGATIGRRFFIDHGAGVVIGETAEIGDDVLLYQGVTLGGVSLEKKKRHPTLSHRVVVGAGAIVLGPILIGEGARIGAGSVVVGPVPARATVVGVPGKVVKSKTPAQPDLEHSRLPDPIGKSLQEIMVRQRELEERIQFLLKRLDETEQKVTETDYLYR